MILGLAVVRTHGVNRESKLARVYKGKARLLRYALTLHASASDINGVGKPQNR